MFIEQLTREQLIRFGKAFLKESRIKDTTMWEITIKCNFPNKTIFDIWMVKHIEKSDYKIGIRMSEDFNVKVLKNVQLEPEVLQKCYVRFMYGIFGEAYKNAYLADVAKIFE